MKANNQNQTQFRTLLCFCFFLCINIAVMYAQTPTVTLELDNAPVKEILTQIEKVTGYVFIYQFRNYRPCS